MSYLAPQKNNHLIKSSRIRTLEHVEPRDERTLLSSIHKRNPGGRRRNEDLGHMVEGND